MFGDECTVALALSAYARGYARGAVGKRGRPDYVEVLTWIGEFVADLPGEYGDDAEKWGKQFIENIANALAGEETRQQLTHADTALQSFIDRVLLEEYGHEPMDNK